MTTLTEAAIRNAKPGPKQIKRSDGGGLYLLIEPRGSKLWRLAYRFGGKQKTLALGVYPAVRLVDARSERDKAKRLLAAGTDPAVQRRADRLQAAVDAANTFKAVADEMVAKLEARRAAATLTKVKWLLSLAAPLDGRPIRDITAAEVLNVLRAIERRGRYETARRLRSTIGSIFRYAIATARADTDPTLALRGALTPPTITPRAAITNAIAFGALLRAIDGYDGQPTTHAALKLLALLFPRPGELRQAEWPEFDLDVATWCIPPERMKMRRPHRLPLPPQAVEILRSLHKITGTGRLVFPSVRSVLRPISENTLNAALRRLGYSKTEATAHGFRATASTLLNESGLWSDDAIERQLAHIDEDSTRRAYARGEYWDERIRMAAWWADYLDQLRAGNVVHLTRLDGRSRTSAMN